MFQPRKRSRSVQAAARLALLLLAVGALGRCSSSAPRGSIGGRVVDLAGRGVEGAPLTLSGPVTTETRTDHLGRYLFRELPAGDYRVELGSGVAVPRDGRPVTLPAGGRAKADFASLPADTVGIARIQGRGPLSPFAGTGVGPIVGVVTALRGKSGFYMQSPLPDDSPATSEGIFVTGALGAGAKPGDLVAVDGEVEEEGAGGGLPVTLIRVERLVRILAGYGVPRPLVLGEGGRLVPDRLAVEGTAFYRSLQGMLVQVNEPVVVGVAEAGAVQVVGDSGRRATVTTARGGLARLEGDDNPERITVELADGRGGAARQPASLSVGDRFLGPITGILDCPSGAYRILPSQELPPVEKAGLPRQLASLRSDERTLTAAVLSVRAPAARGREGIADLAETVVKALHSPDILAVTAPREDPSDAETLRLLLEAIRAVGGPATYRWREVPPQAASGESEAGDGARVGFLYNRLRVQLVERPGVSPAPLSVRASSRPELSVSPGVVASAGGGPDPAGRTAAAEILFRGRRLFVAAARFARGNDDPRRGEEARALHSFVAAILAADPNSDVIVLGDLDEQAYSPLMASLKGSVLYDLGQERLPPAARYDTVRLGNSEDLAHILVSRSLLDLPDTRFEIVHRYCEYPLGSRQEDRDPLLASFRFR